jgi:hypothetical protein
MRTKSQGEAAAVDLKQLIKAGRAALQAAHVAEEATKLGQLRGGSVGALVAGQYFGKCPRVAHLRMRGLQLPAEESKLPMFAAGYANEDIVINELTHAWPGQVLRDDSVPAVDYRLPSGARVTGRPDVILAGADGSLLAGLELKMIASIWTAKAVHYELKPKSDHLIQAGHYSLALGRLPFSLYYCSRVDWHLSTAPKWMQDRFAAGAAGLVHDVEYKDGKPFKILPFDRVYELSWERDARTRTERLHYWTEGMADPVATLLTPESITDYYEAVVALGADGTTGPRPGAKSIDGAKSYSPCDYCPLAATCDQYEDDYQQWMDQATLLIQSAKESADE